MHSPENRSKIRSPQMNGRNIINHKENYRVSTMDLKDPSPDVQNKGKENISVHFRINIQPIYIYMTKISIIQFFSTEQ